MFKKIADKIQFPAWVAKVPRYKTLDVYDRLLCGTFYDHLKYAFFDEKTQAGETVLLEDRRPSAQFHLPGMVGRWSSRKLFAGRHRPKLRLPGSDIPQPKRPVRRAGVKPSGTPPLPERPDPAAVNAAKTQRKKLAPLNKLLRRYRFFKTMAEAVYFGSVGSVAVMFKVELPSDENANPRLALQIWKAKFCNPSFDEFGDLSQLRINYTTTAPNLKAMGITADTDGKVLEDVVAYWFIRDYTPDAEITYAPVKVHEWNPVDGFTGENAERRLLRPIDDKPPWTIKHDLGFVPGQWFTNLPGGEGVDGDCTWKDAIPNSIDLDYSLSQLGRGIRYNSAPQLVVIGNILNGDIERGPMTALLLQAGYKEAGGDGMTIGTGDAKLLEMKGNVANQALEYIDHLRNYALEQIAASRKDPDKMHAPLSGRAMEYLDEDSNDLVMELRSQYGEDGALPLIKKIALASEVLDPADVGMLTLQWPRVFQPTPDELFALAQALQIAVDPLATTAPGDAGQPATPAGPTGVPKPPTPPTDPTRPEEHEQFMTVEQARAYWLLQLDIGMLDLDLDDDAEDEDVNDSPTSPALGTSPVPDPLPLDELPPGPGNEGDEIDPLDQPGSTVHPPSFVA